MFLNSKHLKNQRGFTLVELMTTVAIVGALAAIGVPQYRKIQRKAKRAESTMALGVIASAEAAFFAEYNGYGNSMGGIGAELENAPQHYNTGFLNNCTVETGAAAMNFCERGRTCANANPSGFPGYTGALINAPTPENRAATAVVSGFQALMPSNDNGAAAGALENLEISNCLASAISKANAAGGTPVAGSAASFVSDTTFVATSAGNLYHRTAADVRMDMVTIDAQRVIRLIQDGT